MAVVFQNPTHLDFLVETGSLNSRELPKLTREFQGSSCLCLPSAGALESHKRKAGSLDLELLAFVCH